MSDLTFFTSASGFYRNFVCSYAVFALAHNPGARVEIMVQDLVEFESEHKKALSWIWKQWPGRFLLREDERTEYPANMRRFLVEPTLRSVYVYIGDIDIFIVEEILPFHQRKMVELGLRHSNVIRHKSNRLTGLHFAEWVLMYPIAPLPFKLRLRRSSADEQYLFERVKAKGELPPREHQMRPLHGIHMSPHRIPYAPMGWELYDEDILSKFARFCSTETFATFLALATPSERWLLETLRSTVHAKKILSPSDLGSLAILSYEKPRFSQWRRFLLRKLRIIFLSRTISIGDHSRKGKAR